MLVVREADQARLATARPEPVRQLVLLETHTRARRDVPAASTSRHPSRRAPPRSRRTRQRRYRSPVMSPASGPRPRCGETS
jgi:hypothetical protein